MRLKKDIEFMRDSPYFSTPTPGNDAWKKYPQSGQIAKTLSRVEEGETFNMTFELSTSARDEWGLWTKGTLSQPVTFNVVIGGIRAAGGAFIPGGGSYGAADVYDFPDGNQVTIPAGESSATLRIRAKDDALYRPDQVNVHTLRITGVSGASLSIKHNDVVRIGVYDNDLYPADVKLAGLTVANGGLVGPNKRPGTDYYLRYGALAPAGPVMISMTPNDADVSGTDGLITGKRRCSINAWLDGTQVVTGASVATTYSVAMEVSGATVYSRTLEIHHECGTGRGLRPGRSQYLIDVQIPRQESPGWWMLPPPTYQQPPPPPPTQTPGSGNSRPVAINIGAPNPFSVNEGGTATYSIYLTKQPTGDVTVTPVVSDAGAVTVSPTSRTFNPASPAPWYDAQTFTVSGVSDADANDENVSISHRVASSDARYAATTVPLLTVAVSGQHHPAGSAAAAPVVEQSAQGGPCDSGREHRDKRPAGNFADGRVPRRRRGQADDNGVILG